ncbi:hypothetical protein TSAR_004894 [Trichomalopsis sarcophagae]|uniref:Uncharacterized protein n=1 Tax=Trichomalopsis sarcophagae TaxID=543379 RepID=A0A232EM44_9HYME|nr:hypothetical protein TSAR_004894 [Trichomalopsis sarcophagae]
MGKLQVKSQARERRSFVSPIRRAKNRAGIIESSVRICGDCGEEFCSGESCGDVLYEAFIRVTVSPHRAKARLTADAAAIIAGMDSGQGKSGKKKRKRGGPGMPRMGKSGGKAARLLVRKDKPPGGKGTARKESDRSDDAKAASSGRKFRRKCTKYPTKKRGAASPK